MPAAMDQQGFHDPFENQSTKRTINRHWSMTLQQTNSRKASRYLYAQILL